MSLQTLTYIFLQFSTSDRSQISAHEPSQRHRSNWVDADEDDEDDDDDAVGEENDLCVQSTPPYYEDQ